MKITHLNNSFLIVECGPKIVCDPWAGTANHGGWHSFPEFDRGELIECVQGVNAVYISHLHSDHLCPKFLKEAGLISKTFLIGRMKNPALKNRLKALGVEMILELEPWVPEKFMGAELTIVPQMTSTSRGLKDDINFDLDTSLIVHDGETFFNQVDNPLSANDLRRVSSFIAHRYGKLHIAALVFGAASEYPQCFLGIDRGAEKRRIVGESLKEMGETLRILRPAVFFPAGGSYFIPGPVSIDRILLNECIAQPTFEEIVKANDTESMPVYLEGGRTLGGDRKIRPIRTLRESIDAHKWDTYEHEAQKVAEDAAAVSAAVENWKSQAPKGSTITFHMRDAAWGLVLDGDENKLTIHMDESAFMRCVYGLASWNQTLSGSLCMFERVPNIHNPNDLFGLNFLVSKQRMRLAA